MSETEAQEALERELQQLAHGVAFDLRHEARIIERS